MSPVRQNRRLQEPQQPPEQQESTASRESSSLSLHLRPILVRSPDHHQCRSASCSQQSTSTSSSSTQGECSTSFVDSNQSSDEESCGEDCTTPRAKEYRIPEVPFCPPAPRKRKATSRFRAVPRTGYFIIPDLEAFLPLQKMPVRD